jgi:hypothetical protein
MPDSAYLWAAILLLLVQSIINVTLAAALAGIQRRLRKLEAAL